MGGWAFRARRRVLVVVRDLDFICVPLLPSEADPPLIVDADAMLPGSIANESLESISRRYSKILQRFCCVDQQQLSMCSALDVGRKCPRAFAPKYLFRLGVAKAPNHVS